MQTVVVTGGVTQQQRGWARLPRLVTACEELRVRGRKARFGLQPFVPAIRERCELRVQRRAQVREPEGQRVREVALLAPPEAVSGHDDSRAESCVVGIGAGDSA